MSAAIQYLVEQDVMMMMVYHILRKKDINHKVLPRMGMLSRTIDQSFKTRPAESFKTLT